VVTSEGPVVDANHVQRFGRGQAQARTTRRTVSLLTGSISRLAKLAAGLPPRANPRLMDDAVQSAGPA
jgi:hypothetical protein